MITLTKYSIAILFLLITFAPFYFYLIKAPFLIIIVLAVLHKLGRQGKTLIYENMPLVKWTVYYVCIGILFIFWGLGEAVNGSVLYITLLYVVYPIAYLFLMLGLDIKIVNSLQKIMVWSSVLIAAYILVNILGVVSNDVFLRTPIFGAQLARNATVIEGIAAVALVSVSTLVFVAPYLVAIVQVPNIPGVFRNKRLLLFAALSFIFIGVLLSGRRALFLVFFISYFTFYGFSFFLPRKEAAQIFYKAPLKIALMVFVFFIITFIWLKDIQFDINAYIDSIVATFSEGGDILRESQSRNLLDRWEERPVLGYGHGVAADVIRSQSKPWRYEKSYHALLFHTGVIGVIAYSLGILWIFRSGILIIRRGGETAYTTIALLNGLLAILIAYSSNPYLDAADILWVIFLPAWYINYHSKRMRTGS